MAAGMTQRQLATVAGVSQQEVSHAERGHVDVSLDIRCRLATASGHELSLRFHPVASVTLRDSGQLGIVQAIALVAHPNWTAELERPVAPGDLRAADLMLTAKDEVLHIEVERLLVDAQAQLRAAQLKRAEIASRATKPVRLVMAFPDTNATRARLRTINPLLDKALPTRSRQVWHGIRHGLPIGADGVLLVRTDRVAG